MSENIYTAIADIMKEVGYVQKEKKPGLNYTYAGEAALIQALRPAMVSRGVFMFVKQVLNKHVNSYTNKNGTVMNSVLLDVVITFFHTPSGTFLDVMSSGEGADAGDKAQNKALTGAYKYAMRQTFCIETGDDPDQFSSTEQERASSGKKAEKTEEVKERVWSLDQMDALLEEAAGITDTHETAKAILDMSVLPENVKVTTLKSWFNHFKKELNGGGTFSSSASLANEAYMKAKKGGK